MNPTAIDTLAGVAIPDVWDAIAPRTTHHDLTDARRDEVLGALPRVDFKQQIIQAFGTGTAHKPQTASGDVKADGLERTLPGYRRPNLCEAILASPFAH